MTEADYAILTRPRTGVRFVAVQEPGEIVEGTECSPRPLTVKAAVEAYLGLIAVHGIENTIGIAAFKDKACGVKELNEAIRAARGFADPVPRIGEPLMITQNSADVINGQRYVVAGVESEPGELPLIRARLAGTDHESIMCFKPHRRGPCWAGKGPVDWGYMATVHKYQGSEADAVLVVVPSGTLKLMVAMSGQKEPWFFDRSCLYTACSRPKLELVLVGDPHDICGAIRLNCSNRVTALSRRFPAALPSLRGNTSSPLGPPRLPVGHPCRVPPRGFLAVEQGVRP